MRCRVEGFRDDILSELVVISPAVVAPDPPPEKKPAPLLLMKDRDDKSPFPDFDGDEGDGDWKLCEVEVSTAGESRGKFVDNKGRGGIGGSSPNP